jgi:light-regulated signal transduction histidine kinase (bacteriophytochrome)
MVVRSDGRTGPSAVEASAASAAAAMAAAAESLQARLELVLDERLGPLSADQRGFLQVAKRDGERLLKLISDFHEIALADAGLLELDWSRLELGDAVHQALVSVWPRAHALGKTIEVNVSKPVAMAVDAARVREALARLVQQAVQQGAPGCTIEIEVGDAEIRIAYEAEEPPAPDSLALAHAAAMAHAHGGCLGVTAGEHRVELTLGLAGAGEGAVLPFVVAAA